MIRKRIHLGKLLILVCAFFLIASPSQSQILVGGKLGAGASIISFEEDSQDEFYKVNPGLSYSAGFVTAFRVEKRFFLQAELVYARKSFEVRGKEDPDLRDESIGHYFEMPLFYRIEFKGGIEKKKFKWYAGLGPHLSYWWKGSGKTFTSESDEIDLGEFKYKVSFGYDPDDANEPKTLYIDDPNRLQLGLNIAGGIIFEPPGGSIIQVDLRLEMGHSYQAKSAYGVFSDLVEYGQPAKVRYHTLRLSAAYMLDTKVSERKRGKSTIKR